MHDHLNTVCHQKSEMCLPAGREENASEIEQNNRWEEGIQTRVRGIEKRNMAFLVRALLRRKTGLKLTEKHCCVKPKLVDEGEA